MEAVNGHVANLTNHTSLWCAIVKLCYSDVIHAIQQFASTTTSDDTSDECHNVQHPPTRQLTTRKGTSSMYDIDSVDWSEEKCHNVQHHKPRQRTTRESAMI